MPNTKDIKQIENQLKILLSSDQKNWIQIYLLIDEVDRNQLWKEQFQSFTQWIRHLAEECKVHESLIWTRKKAGKVYQEYQQRAESNNKTVTDLQEIKVSPENLVLIDKISQGNKEVQDDLIGKTLAGELKRGDLKAAWATVKSTKLGSGEKATRVNRYDKVTSKASKLVASDIVLALQKNTWIEEKEVPNRYVRRVYEVMAEFPVQTGTSHHARMIDALVMENINSYGADEIVLHGVEIKVDKNDLLNDHKTSEYEDFVDYLYFAVPEDLVEFAISVAKQNWGILALKEGKIQVIRKAEKNKAIFRDKTLATALVKKLRTI